MSELAELLERVKAAKGPDHGLDAAICIALQYGGKNSEGATNVRTDPEWGDDNDLLFEIGAEECVNPIPELTESMDAALALVERRVPGWEWRISGPSRSQMGWCVGRLFYPQTQAGQHGISHSGEAPTPTLAILSALLAVLLAKE